MWAGVVEIGADQLCGGRRAERPPDDEPRLDEPRSDEPRSEEPERELLALLPRSPDDGWS